MLVIGLSFLIVVNFNLVEFWFDGYPTPLYTRT